MSPHDSLAKMISNLIGANTLNKRETQNALAVIRTAFQSPESIAPESREPLRTLVLLRHLAELNEKESLRRQIAETIAYVQAR